MAQGRGGFRFDIALLMLAVLAIAGAAAAVYLGERVERAGPAIAPAGTPAPSTTAVESGALALAKAVGPAAQGASLDVGSLSSGAESLGTAVESLSGAAPNSPAMREALQSVKSSWEQAAAGLGRMQAVDADASALSSAQAALDSGSDELVTVYRDAVERMRAGVATPTRLLLASEQIARVERLRHLTRRLFERGAEPAALVQAVEAELAGLQAVHTQLSGDGPVGLFLRDNLAKVEALAQAARTIVEKRPAAEGLRAAAVEVSTALIGLQSAAVAVRTGQPASVAVTRHSTPPPHPLRQAVLPALGVALVSLLLFAVVNFVTVRRRIRQAEQKEAAQQQAILGLLDEISSLAEGDLTVRANVTAEFTGAIADSINVTVETLRKLVGTINETAVEISAASTATQTLAQIMRRSSDEQARQVVQITRQVTQSADALTAVAASAEALSQEATQSVGIAHNGASTVGRTISGMASLREQIQDTAKRIKRLGESSQEIGNIIEFINDIAEQTNTLALNASIQAAMAGESGRGFAVVAEEVQQLAERATAATRQVETLVKTIQTDTNEAIVSMERSTSNVVAGARSAEEAGQALTRIESASTDLARLIQDISGAARAESAQATRIAEEMQAVRSVAVQTAGRAQQTADAVVELESLSDKLRQSVAGFKLPPDVSLETGMMKAYPTLDTKV